MAMTQLPEVKHVVDLVLNPSHVCVPMCMCTSLYVFYLLKIHYNGAPDSPSPGWPWKLCPKQKL